MWSTNLLKYCNVNLRNLTIQTGISGPDARELITIEAVGRKWEPLGFTIHHNDLDVEGHPLLDKLWEWHTQGTAPKAISRTGKLAVYMPFGARSENGLVTHVSALDVDMFRRKDGRESDENARKDYLSASKELHEKDGTPFLWSLSRSWGVHHWYFFEKPVPIKTANNFILHMRQLHKEQGLYGEISNGDLENRADPRPKVANAQDISQTHRLLCPYSSWYPHGQFFTGTDIDTPVADDFEITYTKIVQKAESHSVAVKKIDEELISPETHSLDIPHIKYNAKQEWTKVGSNQDLINRKKIDPFETGLDIRNITPCAASIIANRVQIPEGQWHNFLFLQSQSVATLNPEDKETALDQLTEMMNLIGSYGNYAPDNAETFRIPLNSAYKELDKGLPLACKRVSIARDHCCAVECNMVKGGFPAAQGAVAEANAPRVFKRMYTDPLFAKTKSIRYISLCFPAFLKEEYLSPELDEAVFIEFDIREVSKYDRFVGLLRSYGVKNVEKYHVDKLLSIFPKKDFIFWLAQAIDMAVEVKDATPLFRDSFLKLLGKYISRYQTVLLEDEPDIDHPMRIWYDGEGRRRIGILKSVFRNIASELINRSGGIDGGVVADHYVTHVLTGSTEMKLKIPYIDINYPVHAEIIPLEAGVQHYLNRSYKKIDELKSNIAIMDRHKKGQKDEDPRLLKTNSQSSDDTRSNDTLPDEGNRE